MSPTAVVPYFQVHQPFRLRRYTYFDIGVDARWFDDAENERIVRRVAERCYVPTNALLLRRVDETDGRCRCAFTASGPALSPLALKTKIAWRLVQKKIGFRMLMDVIPLDASLGKGSHGRRPENPADWPVFITARR